MSDFLAGQTLTALHFPPMETNTQDDSYTFTNTTFGVTTTGGTYVTCGTAFVAGASGKALILYGANLDNSGAAATNVGPYVRTGATVGSGSDVFPAVLNNCVRNVNTDDATFGNMLPLEGLTPGSSYNVRLEHRVSGGTGTAQYRHVTVITGF